MKIGLIASVPVACRPFSLMKVASCIWPRLLGAVSTLIEWDDHIPEFAVLAATAAEARDREARVLAANRDTASALGGTSHS